MQQMIQSPIPPAPTPVLPSLPGVPSVQKQPNRGSYGCSPDAPDDRDILYVPPATGQHASLPDSVDLRPLCPPIYAQGQLESCSGNAIAAVIQFCQMQLKKEVFVPSALFIYYNERVLEGTIRQDAGARIRDGIKTVVKLGVPPDSVWPYDAANLFRQPPASAYIAARRDLVRTYSRVGQTLPLMQACLAEGFPFVFRFACYPSLDSDETARTGVIPMPGPNEVDDGGHCMVVVGYNNADRTFLIRNSWGTDWGMQGYGTMSYDYLLSPNLTCDLWTIRGVTE